jgi:hypothetical protein
MQINKFNVDDNVWALGKDGKSITRTRVEAIGITINRSSTSVHYRLMIGKGQTWGFDVHEDRIFADHITARAALDKAVKHG